jgi:hypothetical protein
MTLLVLALAAVLTALAPGSRLLAQEGAGGKPSAAAPEAPAGPRRDSFSFTDVRLTDGDHVYEGAEIHVWVKESGGGYTRADYLDERGRRLGFYEAFQVVSRSELALKAWAIRNFPDRTTGAR